MEVPGRFCRARGNFESLPYTDSTQGLPQSKAINSLLGSPFESQVYTMDPLGQGLQDLNIFNFFYVDDHVAVAQGGLWFRG